MFGFVFLNNVKVLFLGEFLLYSSEKVVSCLKVYMIFMIQDLRGRNDFFFQFQKMLQGVFYFGLFLVRDIFELSGVNRWRVGQVNNFGLNDQIEVCGREQLGLLNYMDGVRWLWIRGWFFKERNIR